MDSRSSPKNPTADSYPKRSRIANWMKAGRGKRRVGMAGSPSDIEDRERNTVAWYTSYIDMDRR